MEATNNQVTDLIFASMKELREGIIRLDNKLDSMSDRMTKLESAMTNLSHIDETTIRRIEMMTATYDDAIKRIHSRLDDLQSQIVQNSKKIGNIEHSPMMGANSLIKGILDKIILIATGGIAAYVVSKIIAGFNG